MNELKNIYHNTHQTCTLYPKGDMDSSSTRSVHGSVILIYMNHLEIETKHKLF